jgi:hypothetical protein
MTVSSLIFLPRDILSFIANYFLVEEEQNKKIFPYSYDWRNFMNTSKHYFGQWKKESQLIVLSCPYVEGFYLSEEFQERILSTIENPRLQLDLIFNYLQYYSSNHLTIDLETIKNVRKISVEGTGGHYSVVPRVVNVDEVCLHHCPVEDLSYWSNAKAVEFIPDSTIWRNSFDLTPLENIEKGIFNFSRCVNYHLLANLQSLQLSYCDSISEVRCFQNISVLDLQGCSKITDVSSLGRARKLNLSHCKNISDVSALGNAHTLDLSYCDKVRDLSVLKWVYSLKFHGFKGHDLSGLENIVILDISDSRDVSDISMLQSVEDLTINGCSKVSNLNDLGKLKALELDWEIRITSEGSDIFQQLRKLDIDGDISDDTEIIATLNFWQDSQFLMSLNNLQELSISECHSLTAFPMITGLRSLEIVTCSSLKTIPAFPSLGYLKISECFSLDVLTILGDTDTDSDSLKYPLYTLTVSYCEALTKIQINRKVFKFRIDSCEDLKILELHHQVGHLKTDSVALEKIINQSWIVCLDLPFNEAKLVLNETTDELIFELEVEEPEENESSQSDADRDNFPDLGAEYDED